MSNNPGYNPCPQRGSGAGKIVTEPQHGRWRIRCIACRVQTLWHSSAQLAFDNWQIGQVAAAVPQPAQVADAGGRSA